MKTAIAEALSAQGYDTLTAVQEAVTAPEMLGKDLLVSAQTGSGKTLGFGLAIAPTILGEAEAFESAGAPHALIIAPTRELAMQVKRELSWLFAKTGAVLASTVGGMDMRDERRALARGAHIVVSTPGRLRDHIMRGSIDLSALSAVVLDEADEMLDLGFREDLEFILEQAPEERQTLLFSATVPAAIAKLATNYQKDAERISTASKTTQHADIEYRAFNVSPRDGENGIINVLRFYEAPNAIVFCNTRAMVNRLTTRLSNRGFSVVALSGELSQNERTHALQAMRDGRARVCVATDVAARGIDLPNLELVIHAELPSNQDTLLHRSGRTGRAGRKGVSALIIPPAARKKAQRLLGWAKLRAEWGDAPSADAVTARDDERMLENSDWAAEIAPSNAAIVETLTTRFTPEQLAAAYVHMYRERHSAPEELSDVSAPSAPRESFGPSVWFSLAGGHAKDAEPRRVLPVICNAGNISREDVGAIRITADASLIEIRKSAVDGFLKAVGSSMTLEEGAQLKQLDKAPIIDRGPRGAPKPSGKGGYKGKSNSDGGASKKAGYPKSTPPTDWNDAPDAKPKKPKSGPKGGPKGGPKPSYKGGGKGKPAGSSGKKPGSKAASGGWTKPGPKKGPSDNGGDASPSRGSKPPAGKPSSKKNRARAAEKAAKAKSAKGHRGTT